MVIDQEFARLIKTNIKHYKNIKKLLISRKGAEKLRNNFVECIECTLFDIALCKCSDFLQYKYFVKVSVFKRDFSVDQR